MTLQQSLAQYEALRSLLVGTASGVAIAPPATGSATAADFNAFVSVAYVALRETMAEDIAFLRSVKVLPASVSSRPIYLLRTAQQHTDNADAAAFYRNWTGPDPVDWHDAIARLEVLLTEFCEALVRAATSVRTSPSLHRKWQESVAVAVPSIFDSVCRDLALQFRDGARAAKIRAVESRYLREGSKTPKQPVIADLCAQEVLSETAALPVPHSELLDQLGLIGSREAAAALSLAYATSRALPSLKGDDFSRKVSTAWWALLDDSAK